MSTPEPLTDRELAWVEQAAGREPGNVLTRLTTEIRRLRATRDAVLDIHVRTDCAGPKACCFECGYVAGWPCATVAALTREPS